MPRSGPHMDGQGGTTPASVSGNLLGTFWEPSSNLPVALGFPMRKHITVIKDEPLSALSKWTMVGKVQIQQRRRHTNGSYGESQLNVLGKSTNNNNNIICNYTDQIRNTLLKQKTNAFILIIYDKLKVWLNSLQTSSQKLPITYIRTF